MALQDREQIELDREDGMVTDRPHVVLIKHLAAVWPDGATFMPSTRLVELLVSEHPSAWSEESTYGRRLTVQRFGRMLATSYKLNSGRQRADGPRGYYLASLTPLWSRMGVPLPFEPAEPAEPASHPVPVGPVVPVVPVPGGGVHPEPALACPACAEPIDPERAAAGFECWACYLTGADAGSTR